MPKRQRSLLVWAVVACGTFLPAVAEADDEQPAGTDAAPVEGRVSREHLRRLALAGRGAEVRTAVVDELARDRPVTERAALLEILAVADAWAERGSPVPIEIAPQPSPAGDWSAGLELGRLEVIRGAYTAASSRLATLIVRAPDALAAARAGELRSLAREALRIHTTAAPMAPAAAADAPPTEDAAPSGRPPTRRWYGWQTLITDGAALFATPFVPTAGLGIYLGGAPVVHLTHGRFGTAAVSLGLRVGAPVAGFLTGAALRGFSSDCGFDGRCGYDTAVFGVLGGALGVVAAVTVDAAVLAREEVPVEKPKSTALRPHASPRREGGFDVGLAGTW